MERNRIQNYDIICIGDLCADLLIPYGARKEIEYRCAGSVGNTAQVLGRMNQKPIFIAPIGNDQNGSFLRHEMESCYVNMEYSFEMNTGNMYCIAVLDQRGERTMYAWVPPWGGYPMFKKADFDVSLYKKPGIVFSSGMALNNEIESGKAVLSFMEDMKENGSVLVFDLNVREDSYGFSCDRKTLFKRMLECADVIMGSGMEEFGFVTNAKDLKNAVLQLYAEGKCVIARNGAGSIHLMSDRGYCMVSVDKVKAISTVGAGDTFDAAFLAAFRKGIPLDECVIYASRVAGYMISHKGHLEIPENIEKIIEAGEDYDEWKKNNFRL